MLNQEQLTSFINDALNRIQLKLIRANASDQLSEYAKKYDLSDLLGETIPYCDFYDRRRSKILVIAYAIPNQDDFKVRAKKEYSITEERFEFIEFKPNFDYERLRNSSGYSDIFIGPIPHKGKGIGDYSSFLAAVERNPEDYPKVQRMTTNNGALKISQNSFVNCLANSNLVKNCLDS